MQRNIIAVLVACMMFGAAAALADSPYIKITGGLSYPMDVSSTFGSIEADLSFEPGLAVGGAVGYELTTPILRRIIGSRVELEASQLRNKLDELTIKSGGLSGSADVNGEVSALSFLLNFYGDWHASPRFVPYFGAGLGGSQYEAELNSAVIGDTTLPLAIKEDDIIFTAALMLGARAPMTSWASLGVEYRFQYFNIGDFGADGFGDDTLMYYHTVQAGLYIGF